jgi:hypothetical protein
MYTQHETTDAESFERLTGEGLCEFYRHDGSVIDLVSVVPSDEVRWKPR